jgi:hypothetical protein
LLRGGFSDATIGSWNRYPSSGSVKIQRSRVGFFSIFFRRDGRVHQARRLFFAQDRHSIAGFRTSEAVLPNWILPAALCFISFPIVGWYLSSFIAKPNELVREQPYIAHNYHADAAGLQVAGSIATQVSRRDRRRGKRPGERSGYASEHPAVGLSTSRHAATDSGNPYLL